MRQSPILSKKFSKFPYHLENYPLFRKFCKMQFYLQLKISGISKQNFFVEWKAFPTTAISPSYCDGGFFLARESIKKTVEATQFLETISLEARKKNGVSIFSRSFFTDLKPTYFRSSNYIINDGTKKSRLVCC